jgi:hypothetical protein
MAKWLSSCVEKEPEVRDALKDLRGKIREYEDAAKPSACRETKGGYWSSEIDLFRPDWKLFTAIIVGYGIAGALFSLLVSRSGAGTWADLALTVTVPVFVLGISLVAVARSMSESGSFAVEYLNLSCRMALFCCLTLIAVLAGAVARFSITIESVPNVVTGALCAASLGAAIDCLAMLAFVVRETIRCSSPSESVRVVSQYAARNLCCAYLKEAYLKLFLTQHRDYLDKWCKGRAVHPPSQYYGHYFKSSLYSGEGEDDVEIELHCRHPGENEYKDYDLGGLGQLDKYLKENNAELWLSSPLYEGEKRLLGILSAERVRKRQALQGAVLNRGRQVVRFREAEFVEEDDDFWDSQESKLNVAVERAVEKGDPIQLRAYLDAVNRPLSVLRSVRRHPVVRDAYGEYVRRGYDFVRLYLRALREVLARQKNDPKYRIEDANKLLRVVRASIWDETKSMLRDSDYHTMELFTWVVPEMYKVIRDAGDEGKVIGEMRAQFGGFYEFAGGWLEDSESRDAGGANKMRVVLHEGLTKWLLIAMKEKDVVLTEPLCDTGREIVFGREEIGFDRGDVVAQHFVLAGYFIGQVKGGAVGVTTEAIERLFCERHSHDVRVDLGELVKFYIGNPLPVTRLDSYLRIFFTPSQVKTDPLTGSSSSTGWGMMGSQEMELAFIFVAAKALQRGGQLPEPTADMAGKINEENLKIVSEVFKGDGLDHWIGELRDWKKKCEELDDAEEAKQIAEAELDTQKVDEWKKNFWERYSRAVPVLSMCLKSGEREIDEEAKSEWRYTLPKIAVIDWKHGISGAEGGRYGHSIGRRMEKELVKRMIGQEGGESRVEGGLSGMMDAAAGWLENKGCDGDKGIVVVAGKRAPGSELFGDKNFVAPWREDVRAAGFDGFYREFPIVWIGEEEDDEAENAKGDNRIKCERVVAVDLRGWRGIRVRNEVITKRRFGELGIRTWRDEEIQKAIESKKLDVKDGDKAKGSCPVDITFFWAYAEAKLPPRNAFVVVGAEETPVNGAADRG